MQGTKWILFLELDSGRPLMSRKLNTVREQLVRYWQWVCEREASG